MTDYTNRRENLLSRIDGDGFITINLEGSDWVSMYYLSGFTGEGGLVVTKDETLLITDSRYTEQAGREVPELPVHQVRKNYEQEIGAAISKLGIKRLVLSSRRMSHYLVAKLSEIPGVEVVPAEDPVGELRRIKDADEIARIRNATRVTEESLAAVLKEIEPGTTEREIALRLEWLMRTQGAEKVAFDLIIAAGENSSLPHYQPGDRKVNEGDLLLCDIGARVDHYCSDMTRVFAVGEPSSKAKEIYDLVLRANRAGVAALRPGATGVEVDAAARDVIAAAGHKEHFGHGLGHGVGLEVHEFPRLSPLSNAKLAAGMVVTVEPGVYLPGFGGVRIEDLLVVTPDGCESLTQFPRDRLEVIG